MDVSNATNFTHKGFTPFRTRNITLGDVYAHPFLALPFYFLRIDATSPQNPKDS